MPAAFVQNYNGHRSDRYLKLLDEHLKNFPTNQARLSILDKLMDVWEDRYNAFLASEGESEFCSDRNDPIHVTDFLVTIVGIGARRSALGGS